MKQKSVSAKRLIADRMEPFQKKTDRRFGQDGVVKGPDDPRRMGGSRALEAGCGMCCRRRIACTVWRAYRASDLASAFDGLEMWR
jgi:hypothetical protein